MKSIVLGVALAVGVLGAVIFMRGGVSLREPGPEAAGRRAQVEVKRRYAPETVLNITPHAAVEKTAGGKELSPRGSPLIQEYRQTRQYGALVARLDAKRPRSPEENWLLAEMLEWCGNAAAARTPRIKDHVPPTREEMIRNFADNLSEKDPHREKRIAAYTSRMADRCEGVRAAAPNELRELRQAAASGGEIKAQVRLARDEIHTRPLKVVGGVLSHQDVAKHADVIRAALESGEPYAMQVAAGLLNMPQGNMTARIGPNEIPIVDGIFQRAAMALSCELGAPCGPGSDVLMEACAQQGACDARDLREYYFFYALSPNQSQLMHEYADALRRVVRSRDWSQIRLVDAVPRISSTYMP